LMVVNLDSLPWPFLPAALVFNPWRGPCYDGMPLIDGNDPV